MYSCIKKEKPSIRRYPTNGRWNLFCDAEVDVEFFKAEAVY